MLGIKHRSFLRQKWKKTLKKMQAYWTVIWKGFPKGFCIAAENSKIDLKKYKFIEKK